MMCQRLREVKCLGLCHTAVRRDYAFNQCKSLTTLILRSPVVCTLAATSAFNSTPFNSTSTEATVYVPQALVETYQAATNWATLYTGGRCNFVAIEGSEYE